MPRLGFAHTSVRQSQDAIVWPTRARKRPNRSTTRPRRFSAACRAPKSSSSPLSPGPSAPTGRGVRARRPDAARHALAEFQCQAQRTGDRWAPERQSRAAASSRTTAPGERLRRAGRPPDARQALRRAKAPPHSARLQVARNVTSGATNREAAAALFLSLKTIEFHLAHICRKLGVRTRTELALVAARRGWRDDAQRSSDSRIGPAWVPVRCPSPREAAGRRASRAAWAVATTEGHSPQTCLRDYDHLFDDFDPSRREPAEGVISAARASSYLSRTFGRREPSQGRS